MSTKKPQAKTLYLIDGHAHFFRAYHAIRSGMASPVTKEPTNMTFGFVGILLKLLREHKPDYLVVAIDVSGDKETFRSQLYPDYKAHREETPEDFRPQVERCLQVLEQMGVPVVGEAGVEADDVIASLVRRFEAEHEELRIRIVSRDKDLAQLISDRVDLLDIYKNETITPPRLFGTEGVEARHVRDILALMGDPTDNVPGVPGIGPKTAAQLIARYGSLEELMSHLDEIKGKRRENLEASRDLVSLSRQLVTLKDDLSTPLDLESARCEVGSIPVERLLAVFRELGFNRYQTDLVSLTRGGREPSGPAGDQNELFPSPVRRPPPADAGDYALITTGPQLDEFLDAVRAAGEVAVDTETDGLSPIRAHLCGVSLSIRPRTGVYVPTRSPEPSRHLDTESVLARMRPVLEDESIGKIGHNLKFDFNVFRHHGVRLAGISFDTMIASYLIDATRSSHKLDVLALALLKYGCIPITDVIGSGRQQTTFDRVPLDVAVRYAAEDADIALRLRDALAPALEELDLTGLFHDVEMPLLEVLAELEYNGIRIDPAQLDRQRAGLGERIEALRRRISDAAPHPFNPDSPRQLAGVLFNRPDQEPPGLGLPVARRGKTGPSTDQEVLERLASDPDVETPVPALIVEYRQLTKLVSTYLVALKDAINPATGRVHASFNQTVAATGRLSSSDPNLQNVPVRTEVGREIRRAFVAEPGPPEHVLISADYSQIELRLLAHLSEDVALIDAFHRGVDIHTAAAADVFGVDPDEVTPAQRDTAKMVNFGIIYGITAYGLARRLGAGVAVEDAARFIGEYKARYPKIDDFLKRCIETARAAGYVETILKRRRPIPQVKARHPQRRALGERMAINSVVQGSAADLIKLAMIDLYRELPPRFPAAKMLLQIHDELVFEALRAEAEPVRAFVCRRMESALELRVPLVVESAWSTRWIDVK
ncbi:MAG: DNA polymerase I [Planctomycetota bacterium]|jgi:DNA polymerase-1